MTPDDPRDPPPPPPPGGAHGDLDELVSALLDGDLRGDAAEAARRRPEVAARLAGMATAREALRDLPRPGTPAREATIRAALDAYDAADAAPDAGFDVGPASVDDLGARRAARSPHHAAHRGRRWVGAAAAAVLIAVVGVAIARSDGDDTTTATSADSEATSRGDEAGGSLDAATPAPQSAPDDSVAAGARDRAVDLGTYPSVDDLLDGAATVDRRAPSAPSAGAGADSTSEALVDPLAALSDRCPAGVPVPIARAGVDARLIGRGTVDGAPVEVWSAGTADDPRLVALDAACGVLSDRPLD